MKIPFFNLKAKAKIRQEITSNVYSTVLDLLKISEDNGKKVNKVILSEAAYRSIYLYVARKKSKQYIFDIEIQRIPDVSVIWKKDK